MALEATSLPIRTPRDLFNELCVERTRQRWPSEMTTCRLCPLHDLRQIVDNTPELADIYAAGDNFSDACLCDDAAESDNYMSGGPSSHCPDDVLHKIFVPKGEFTFLMEQLGQTASGEFWRPLNGSKRYSLKYRAQSTLKKDSQPQITGGNNARVSLSKTFQLSFIASEQTNKPLVAIKVTHRDPTRLGAGIHCRNTYRSVMFFVADNDRNVSKPKVELQITGDFVNSRHGVFRIVGKKTKSGEKVTLFRWRQDGGRSNAPNSAAAELAASYSRTSPSNPIAGGVTTSTAALSNLRHNVTTPQLSNVVGGQSMTNVAAPVSTTASNYSGMAGMGLPPPILAPVMSGSTNSSVEISGLPPPPQQTRHSHLSALGVSHPISQQQQPQHSHRPSQTGLPLPPHQQPPLPLPQQRNIRQRLVAQTIHSYPPIPPQSVLYPPQSHPMNPQTTVPQIYSQPQLQQSPQYSSPSQLLQRYVQPQLQPQSQPQMPQLQPQSQTPQSQLQMPQLQPQSQSQLQPQSQPQSQPQMPQLQPQSQTPQSQLQMPQLQPQSQPQPQPPQPQPPQPQLQHAQPLSNAMGGQTQATVAWTAQQRQDQIMYDLESQVRAGMLMDSSRKMNAVHVAQQMEIDGNGVISTSVSATSNTKSNNESEEKESRLGQPLRTSYERRQILTCDQFFDEYKWGSINPEILRQNIEIARELMEETVTSTYISEQMDALLRDHDNEAPLELIRVFHRLDPEKCYEILTKRVNFYGNTLYHMITWNNNDAFVRELCDISPKYIDPFLWAQKETRHAQGRIREPDNKTPLHTGAMCGRDKVILEVLKCLWRCRVELFEIVGDADNGATNDGPTNAEAFIRDRIQTHILRCDSFQAHVFHYMILNREPLLKTLVWLRGKNIVNRSVSFALFDVAMRRRINIRQYMVPHCKYVYDAKRNLSIQMDDRLRGFLQEFIGEPPSTVNRTELN